MEGEDERGQGGEVQEEEEKRGEVMGGEEKRRGRGERMSCVK